MRPVRHLLIALSIVLFASTAVADTTPQTLPFTQDWTDVSLITADDVWTGVPGIVGYKDDLVIGTGVDPRTVLTPGVLEDVNANKTTPDTFNTGGVTEFEIADPVVALSGSGTADAPHIVLTLNTTGVTNVRIRYNLRDIDASANSAVQQYALQYRVGMTGDFTDVPEGYVADATTGPSLATLVTPIDVLLPSAVGNQSVVQIRILTTNAVGNDERVGIDDISVTNATTNPSAVGTATPSSALRSAAVSLSATVTPGAVPTSTGLAVVCDLSSMAGSATQTLFDDGTNGDTTASDNVFTFDTTVPVASTAGAKTFPCTVTDTQARTGTFNISFTVTAVCGDGITEGVETCDDNGTTPGDGCSATCTVESGYACTMASPSVCTDIDECTLDTDNCDANATCANTVGSFTCACNSGYMGTGTTCADIDECTAGTDTCDTNATCTNTAGAFTCACKTGFTGDGMTCTDVNECTAGTDNCDTNATCTNQPGSFTCACIAGYSGNGATCAPNCGDGILVGAEVCDDSDMTSGDGCSMNCEVETGYACTGTPSTCKTVCGDGLKVGSEACDDGNTFDEDGCDAQCTLEDGFTCTGTPSVCEPPDDGGCCSSSTNPGGVALFVMFVMFGLRPRRRR
jgi:cysteine-rich repeat protein